MDRRNIKPELFFAIVFPLLMATGLFLIATCVLGTGFVFWGVAALVCLLYAQRWSELLYALVGPRRLLPRLETKDVSIFHTSIVTMSTLLRSEEETRNTLENLERNFLSNPEDIFLFCFLADFQDSEEESRELDARLVRQLQSHIAELNRKHGDRFFALVRRRRWNTGEKCWMGWERKRGKLTQFNRWLLGREADDLFVARLGAFEHARGARFVLPIDEDTWIADGGALRLVATIAHPANAPVFDELGKLISGYTILSPAIRAFNPLLAPYDNIDTSRLFKKTRRISIPLFGQMYCGKGIYDLLAFERTTEGLFPENRILSHDRLEGLCGNAAFVPDVTFWEDVPQNRLAYFRRHERWVRGDIQALVMLPKIFQRSGGLAAWALLYPLFSVGIYPALIVLWVNFIVQGRGFTSAVILTLLGSSRLLPQLPHIAAAMAGMLRVSPFKSMGEGLICITDLLRKDLLMLGDIISYAVSTVRAFAKSSYRLFVSKQKLLEWTPAGETA